jgi:hypothetical protein
MTVDKLLLKILNVRGKHDRRQIIAENIVRAIRLLAPTAGMLRPYGILRPYNG